jgi:hypothetical protein
MVVVIALASSAGAAPPPTVSASATTNEWSVSANTGVTDKRSSSNAEPVQQTVACSAADVWRQLTAGDPCTIAIDSCAAIPAAGAAGNPSATIAAQIQEADGTTHTISVDCTAANPQIATPIAAAAHDAFAKLVPTAKIAAAGQHNVSLVNVETLFWLDTPANVDLGSTPLLGQQVHLLASIQSVTWDFGDGHSAISQGPGRPFLETDHCGTASCPGWFGHTYTATAAKLTVTATATWIGRYSVNGGPFVAIAGTVTAPPATVPMPVVEARTVLVPNPTATG